MCRSVSRVSENSKKEQLSVEKVFVGVAGKKSKSGKIFMTKLLTKSVSK